MEWLVIGIEYDGPPNTIPHPVREPPDVRHGGQGDIEHSLRSLQMALLSCKDLLREQVRN